MAAAPLEPLPAALASRPPDSKHPELDYTEERPRPMPESAPWSPCKPARPLLRFLPSPCNRLPLESKHHLSPRYARSSLLPIQFSCSIAPSTFAPARSRPPLLAGNAPADTPGPTPAPFESAGCPWRFPQIRAQPP